MPRLLSVEIVPYYGQVLMFDPSVEDSIPVPETGEERVTASRMGLAVHTRSDWVAARNAVVSVMVEVWMGERPAAEMSEVWTGELLVGDRAMVVGTVIGADLHSVPVPAGTLRVTVLVQPLEAPEFVAFVLSGSLEGA